MSTLSPAEGLSVGRLIAEELEARGWTTMDLAQRMPGSWHLNMAAIDLMVAVDDPNLLLGDMAEKLGAAFGTSAELWRNLEARYRARHPDTRPESPATAPRAQRATP